MSGLKSGLAAVVLMGACGAPAWAQGIVPGGWAAEFGYQSFGGMGIAGGAMYGSAGVGGSPFGYSPYGGGVSPYSYGGGGVAYGVGMGPAYNQGVLPGMTAPMPQTVNGTGSLIGAIRQTTRRSARR